MLGFRSTILNKANNTAAINALRPRGQVDRTTLGINGGNIDDVLTDLVDQRGLGRTVRCTDVRDGIG